MRRISLAMALLGAVAAAGCSGSSKPGSSTASKGTPGSTFTVQVRGESYNYTDPVTNTSVAAPVGGTVTSSPAGINCGNGNYACKADFPVGTPVVLTASTSPMAAHGFAGDCTGHDDCTLTGNSDKIVLVRFAPSLAGVGSHTNFSSPAVHGPEYLKLQLGQGSAYDCTVCHGGAALLGAGLAPSCASCHAWPLSAHFDATRPAFGDHGGWGAACLRCHTSQGYQDYTGADGSADYKTGLFAPTSVTTATTAACVAAGNCYAGAYSYGPLKCATCHNPAINPVDVAGVLAPGSAPLDGVNFYEAGWASNPVVASANYQTLDASSAVCAQCHEARESGPSIEAKIAQWGASYVGTTNANATVSGKSFLNPHYRGAAAIFYGSKAAGMVQYSGQIYTGPNEHGGVAGCTYCHNAHTLELPPDGTAFYAIGAKCGSCHYNEAGARISTFIELEDVRQFGFEGDADGDGVPESIKDELDGVAAQVYANLQDYAVQVVGTTVTYTESYPYFMNSSGAPLKKWSPRLMRAAVNLKWFHTESGAWAHNPRYMLEVLFDTAADLRLGIREKGLTPAAAFTAKRAFNGHFGAAEDPSPYAAMMYHPYDPGLGNGGFTSAACYQCHGGKGGFAAYLAGAPAALTNTVMTNKVTAMQCSTCHTLTGTSMTTIRSDVANVYFPPQKNGGNGQVTVAAANLPAGNAVCATCHSGRENGASITAKGGTDGTFSIAFVNPHYLGAAGVMMGSNAGMLYQYAGKAYTGYPAFWSLTANGPHGSPHAAKCTSCHSPKGSKHTFEIDLATSVPTGTYQGAVNTKSCNGCHIDARAYGAGDYRLAPKALEFEEASAALLAAIQGYVASNLTAFQAGSYVSNGKTYTNAGADGVCYSANANPYWFISVGGVCQDGIANAPAASRPAAWDPKGLKAAFNYQWTQKEPGAWAHNEFYVLQAIYDSIVDLGGTPAFTVSASTTDATLNRP